MTRPRPDALLTLDEAADLVGRSAIALVDALSDKPQRLAELLTGVGTTRGLTNRPGSLPTPTAAHVGGCGPPGWPGSCPTRSKAPSATPDSTRRTSSSAKPPEWQPAKPPDTGRDGVTRPWH